MADDRRWLVRTRNAGVFVDVVWVGEGELPGEYVIRGRRLHSWRGGALACGDLARKGPAGGRLEAEGELRVYLHDLAERRVMTEAALGKVRALPDWEG